MTTEAVIYRFCAQTDSGLTRENNEDAYSFDEAAGVAVLADGMGGYNAGEVASSMASNIITKEMSRWLAEAGEAASVQDMRRALEICVSNANTAVFRAAHDNSHYSGMGTTLVAGVFRGSDLEDHHVNIGPNTEPGSFRFARNHWYCEDDPSRSRPQLPASEEEGTYGVKPAINIDSAGLPVRERP